MQGDIADLKQLVLVEFPHFATSRMTIHDAGWDSIAIDIDDRIICKFPRSDEAAVSLRREQKLLSVIGARVDMPVPQTRLVETGPLFSVHEKIPGEHLLADQYARLSNAKRDHLARSMGHFYAQLHAIPPELMRAAGGLPKPNWPDAEQLSSTALQLVPEEWKRTAIELIDRWASLAADQLGQVYGFMDGHGWNMAFDHQRQILNGIYDFGDSGFGARHQEFIYSGFVSFDLTERIISAYEVETGLVLDRDRIDLLTGIHRLTELAETAGEPGQASLIKENFLAWAHSRRR